MELHYHCIYLIHFIIVWLFQRITAPLLAVAASLAAFSSSRAFSLASYSSFLAFHSFLLFRMPSSMGWICGWKRENSWEEKSRRQILLKKFAKMKTEQFRWGGLFTLVDAPTKICERMAFKTSKYILNKWFALCELKRTLYETLPCRQTCRQSQWNHTVVLEVLLPCFCPSWAGGRDRKCLMHSETPH